ncbi:hypothetical protein GCM10009839_06930 [Catenulispora yoronensis]|uniref:Uncharacterized protein n=1 Tax=Catenulispora yoronensis TaxID=450799 RepID=A0ABP5F2X0_9ACTN
MIDSWGFRLAGPHLTCETCETAQQQAWVTRTDTLSLVWLWVAGRGGQAPLISRFAPVPPGINHLGLRNDF